MQKEILQAAIQEIRALRQENAILRAQVNIINTFQTALNTYPNSQPMGVDLTYIMEKAMADLDKQPSEPANHPTKVENPLLSPDQDEAV